MTPAERLAAEQLHADLAEAVRQGEADEPEPVSEGHHDQEEAA